jgi:hypothetical protein
MLRGFGLISVRGAGSRSGGAARSGQHGLSGESSGTNDCRRNESGRRHADRDRQRRSEVAADDSYAGEHYDDDAESELGDPVGRRRRFRDRPAAGTATATREWDGLDRRTTGLESTSAHSGSLSGWCPLCPATSVRDVLRLHTVVRSKSWSSSGGAIRPPRLQCPFSITMLGGGSHGPDTPIISGFGGSRRAIRPRSHRRRCSESGRA